MEHSPILQLSVPGGETQVLLHACCAPCSGAILECMLQNELRPTLFYFNPNIYPRAEYETRKNESKRYAELLQVPFIDGDYDHADWLQQVRGLEHEPERGRRCQACFDLRLHATAHIASERGFRVFTTTLASSRWKNLEQIDRAGQQAAAQYPGTHYWNHNWRKGGLSNRRQELIREHDFYNQTYCGCEFSIRASHPHTDGNDS